MELSGLEGPGGLLISVPRMVEEAEEEKEGGIRLGKVKKDALSTLWKSTVYFPTSPDVI